MSSKRKTRSESAEPRKRQATQEKEVISLLTPEKTLNSTSDEQKQDLQNTDNAKNNITNNENNSNKNEQDSSNSKKEEDLQCGICLDKPSVQGKLDSCTHMFCFECIEHWSKTANTCPFCKARFKQLIKIDLLNPENNKKMKKVRVRHADQRPDYDDPEEWIVYDDDGYEDEDGWLDDDLASWGMPWPAPQSLPGNFWTQFLAGSLPEAFEVDADDFIDDGERDDFIDLTDEPEFEDEFLLDYDEDEPSDDYDIGNIDISSLVREVFHPYSRLAAPPTTTTSRRRSSSSRIRNLQAQMRNSRSSNSRNNTNNTNNRNNSNNNNSQRTSSQRDSAISARTRSQSSNNSNNRHLRSNTQRNNTNNRSTRRS